MRKNISSQHVAAQMNSRTDGSPLTTSVSVYVTVDGGTQNAGGGTLTHKNNGHWDYVPTQAETNGNHIAFTFVHTTGVDQTVNVYTVSFDPHDTVRLGVTALPNAAAEAAGGLFTRGTGAGQINQDANGRVDTRTAAIAANAITATAINADAITAAKVAADVTTEVQSGLATSSALSTAQTDIDDIQTRLPSALVGGKMDSHVNDIAANAITDAAVATDMDSYTAKIWVIKDGTTTDRYAVRWFKNAVPITSGITSPTIQVIKGSDGTDLIASTALTEIGSTHRFKRDEGTNKMVAGQIYFAVVSATIDGSTRTFEQQVGRDSGA